MVNKTIASSPGRQLKFRKNDGLVPIATASAHALAITRNRILSL